MEREEELRQASTLSKDELYDATPDYLAEGRHRYITRQSSINIEYQCVPGKRRGDDDDDDDDDV